MAENIPSVSIPLKNHSNGIEQHKASMLPDETETQSLSNDSTLVVNIQPLAVFVL